MTPHRCEQFVQRSALLLDMLDGSLSKHVSEHVKEEIRRVLNYLEPPVEAIAVPLGNGAVWSGGGYKLAPGGYPAITRRELQALAIGGPGLHWDSANVCTVHPQLGAVLSVLSYMPGRSCDLDRGIPRQYVG